MNKYILTSCCILSSCIAFGGEIASKAVHTVESEVSWYTFDFQERLRFEVRENTFDFNDSVSTINDDSWLLQRARLGIALRPSDYFSLYIQGQSSFELGSDRPNEPGIFGSEGDDPLDLRQAYLKIGNTKFNLTLGRQILSFGDERLVGSFDWNNIGRTFDAVKLHYENRLWSLDAFASSVVVPNSESLNQSDWLDGNETHRDQVFSGLYFSTKALGPQSADLYAFHLFENLAAGDTSFFTLGTRIKADVVKTGGWDYEMELAYQTGELGGKDLTAFAGHLGLGYVWLKHSMKPRVFVEYNYGTGDQDPADDQVETFQNLFPTNHKFYGYMDVFSWQNMHNPALSLSVQPLPNLKVQLDYHAFWLADSTDAWYRANGVTAVRPVNGAASRFVGTELDFSLHWKATKQLSFLVGYSHFFAGDYLKTSGSHDDADFAYVQTTFEF